MNETAYALVVASKKEDFKKQSEAIQAKAADKGYDIVHEFQALTFPSDQPRDLAMADLLKGFIKNRGSITALVLMTERALGEDTLAQNLLSLMKQQLGVDVVEVLEDL